MDKFNNLIPLKKNLQEETIRVIKSVINIEFNLNDIEEHKKIIYIKTKNFSLKNEIFFKKNLILDILQKKMGNKAPIDLRFKS